MRNNATDTSRGKDKAYSKSKKRVPIPRLKYAGKEKGGQNQVTECRPLVYFRHVKLVIKLLHAVPVGRTHSVGEDDFCGGRRPEASTNFRGEVVRCRV